MATSVPPTVIEIAISTSGIPTGTSGTGWRFDGSSKTLTLDANNIFYLTGPDSNCHIVNSGTIQNAAGHIRGEMSNHGTIDKCTFDNSVTNTGTIDSCTFNIDAPVTNTGTIDNCTFNGLVEDNSGTIDNCTFNGPVTNKGKIDSCTFNSSVDNSGTISNCKGNSMNPDMPVSNKSVGTIDGNGTFISAVVVNEGTIAAGTFSGTILNNSGAHIRGGVLNRTVINNGAIIPGPNLLYGVSSAFTGISPTSLPLTAPSVGTYTATLAVSSMQVRTLALSAASADGRLATPASTSGNALPKTITVTLNGKEAQASEYTWNPFTGALSIPATSDQNKMGPIEITAAAVQSDATFSLTYTGPDDGTFVAPAAIHEYVLEGVPYYVASPTVVGYEPDRTSVSGTMGKTDVVETVTYTANAYTVAFDANAADATGSMAPESFTYGTAKALTTNTFSRVGYTFQGWSTSRDATTVTYADGGSVKNLSATDSSTVTLYAVWKADASASSTTDATATKTGDRTPWIPLVLATLGVAALAGGLLQRRRRA